MNGTGNKFMGSYHEWDSDVLAGSPVAGTKKYSIRTIGRKFIALNQVRCTVRLYLYEYYGIVGKIQLMEYFSRGHSSAW